MTAYSVSILRRAQRELARLPSRDYERPGCLRLTGRDGWRIRIGIYRVIYEVDDALTAVIVLNVGHRRDVYR